MARPDPERLAHGQVSYQAAQFLHLEEVADVHWDGVRGDADAVLVWDEKALLTDPRAQAYDGDALLVWVGHDWWCHPLRVVDALRRPARSLMVLRHDSARRFFDLVAPELAKVVARPGVETAIFHPHDGVKRHDVLLSGSETPDYPVRRRVNAIVREQAPQRGWSLLDLTGVGLMSNPPGEQWEYAPALAAAKVSPTGTNRGGGRGGALLTQYLDLSPARAQVDDPFYGLATPEVAVLELDTAGITPRYLESLAAGTLLIGDLPPGESARWYADKMVALDPEAGDAEIADLIDRWVRDDAAREALCARAREAVLATETSQRTAHALAETIRAHL
jgi:Glycosyl transferases group 1